MSHDPTNRIIVTSSWDDGHVLDLKLAALLRKYGIQGTFYIAPHCKAIRPNKRLSEDEIKQLAQDFEIGSHTMSHHMLSDLSQDEATRELVDSRNYLHKLTGQAIDTFCYPRGVLLPSTVELVKKAGYGYARTLEDYRFDVPPDLFESGTSIEAHRLPIPYLLSCLVKLGHYCHWQPFTLIRNLSWEQRAKTMFDQVRQEGGVFHLWGHSWVVEKEGGWKKLERVLEYIGGHEEVTYAPNSIFINMSNNRSER